MTMKWLLHASPTSLAIGIPFFESIVCNRGGHLEESIRHGRPAVLGSEWLDQHPGGYRVYEEGMIAIARMEADEVFAKVRVPAAARRLLDVGGGHGLYSIRFCRRHSCRSATVIDLAPALEVARETIAAEGMGGRVTTQVGDVWRDDFGAGYDVVLLFNLIHAYWSDQNTALLRKIAYALNPGGLIVIMEQMAGQVLGSAATALARLKALNYVNDLEAQTYTYAETRGWLTQADFANPRGTNLLKTPGASLVLATKAA
jgi:2-polyprenyl-3-methyl-5-hydroxy-6-metoxy-1,4-benzoquinol methylase